MSGGGGGSAVLRLLLATRKVGSVVGVGTARRNRPVVARVRRGMSSTLVVVVVVAGRAGSRPEVAKLVGLGLLGMVVVGLVGIAVDSVVGLVRIAMGGCSPSGLSRRKTLWC
jgi:hypothetical protein